MRFGLLVGITALAIAGRIAFLWWPNVSLTYAVVFLAGVAWGARFGAAVGILSMTVTNLLLSGLHPVLLVNGPAMAALGAAGGLLGRVVDFGQRSDANRIGATGAAAFVGVAATVAFSLLSDTLSFLLFGVLPTGAWNADAFTALVLAGLAFNAVPAAANGVAFAVLSRPVLVALRRAELLPDHARDDERGNSRERVDGDRARVLRARE